jgi:hypothetical protein
MFEKRFFFTFYFLLLHILVFSCIFYNGTINTVKFKSFVEVYPIEGNPIEVHPIEAYLIGKGVVEVSGCSPPNEGSPQGTLEHGSCINLPPILKGIGNQLKNAHKILMALQKMLRE